MLFLALSATLHALPPEVSKERIRGTATIKGIRAGLLHVQTKQGDQYLMKLDAKPQEVRFTGSAESGWLRPGLLVRLAGRFNKKGEAQTPVSTLTVFTPRADTRIGVFADINAGAQDLFGSDDESRSAEKAMPFLVAGRLRDLRNGRLTVVAGQAVVRAQLADDAEIKLDIGDLRLAKPGDHVSFEGWYYPQRKQEIYVHRIEVEGAEPLRGESRSPTAKPAPDEKTPDEKSPDEKTPDEPSDDGDSPKAAGRGAPPQDNVPQD